MIDMKVSESEVTGEKTPGRDIKSDPEGKIFFEDVSGNIKIIHDDFSGTLLT